MNKKRLSFATIILVGILRLTLLVSCLPAAFGAHSVPSEQGCWVISVRELIPIAKSPEAKRLCGMTYLRGFCVFEDEEGLNLALISLKEPGRPTLRLDDFVVAWRNASTGVATPGCSIDPMPETLEQLAALSRKIDAEDRLDRLDSLFQRWRTLASSPQKVLVFGVHRATHFARVMVEADYRMKDFVHGQLPRPRVRSPFEESLEESKRAIASDSPRLQSSHRMSRFWFVSGNPVVYRHDAEDTMLLGQLPLVLLTEEQTFTRRGELVDVGRADPADERFAQSFTAEFDKIARDHPIFRELENIYRALAITKMLWQLDRPEINALLDELVRRTQLDRPSVPETLPGKYRVETVLHRRNVAGGYIEARSWVMAWGGVSVDVAITPQCVVNVPKEILIQVREQVVVAQPNVRAPCWFCSPHDPCAQLPP